MEDKERESVGQRVTMTWAKGSPTCGKPGSAGGGGLGRRGRPGGGGGQGGWMAGGWVSHPLQFRAQPLQLLKATDWTRFSLSLSLSLFPSLPHSHLHSHFWPTFYALHLPNYPQNSFFYELNPSSNLYNNYILYGQKYVIIQYLI